MAHTYNQDGYSKDEVCDEIVAFFHHLREEEYPSVWVGEPGISALDLLGLPGYSDDPFKGERMVMEGGRLGVPRLNGLDVVQDLLVLSDVPDDKELFYEVMCIFMAKQFLAILPVWREDLSHGWKTVSLDQLVLTKLPSEELDELLWVVEHVRSIRERRKHEPYVILDTEPVRRFLEEHEFYG